MRAPSIRLVVPHFGERPAYFPLVVNSMACNPDVHWLMITDHPVADAPPNLAVQLCRFGDLSERIKRHFDFDISLTTPYKLCDFRPAFGQIFAQELRGYDFWGHSDLDVIFGRIREFLPREAFEADKVLFQGNFALYRNTPEAASWFRHVVGKVDYREVFSTPAAMHFDEWAGIYYIVEDLGVSYWQEDVIFDLSFHMYRTRDEAAPGRDPRRYAWENGEICEYRLEKGQIRRRTALLVHLQKRTMRAPSPEVLQANHYWISANRFAPQERVTRRSVAAARVPSGREILPFYWQRLQRNIRRRRMATTT